MLLSRKKLFFAPVAGPMELDLIVVSIGTMVTGDSLTARKDLFGECSGFEMNSLEKRVSLAVLGFIWLVILSKISALLVNNSLIEHDCSFIYESVLSKLSCLGGGIGGGTVLPGL